MRVVSSAVIVGAAACGFHATPAAGGDDAASDAAGDASDAAADADANTPTVCVQHWLTGPTFGAPVRLDQLNTTSGENDVYVSRDQLRLYFARSGSIYLATRPDTASPWGAPGIDPTLDSPQDDTKLSFTNDELTVFINSDRPSGGSNHVWRGTRATIGAAFTFDQTDLSAVDALGSDQWDPHISGDGLHLYYAPAGGAITTQHVLVATRATTGDAFGTPAAIPEITSTSVENDPTITLDERVIVFASNRNAQRGLWYATRADKSQSFGAPIEITALNSSASDDGPHVTADGCHIYFSSSRNTGNDDLYVADVQ